MSETLYKFTAAGGQSPYGRGVWHPGKWRTVKPPLKPCSHGLHYCRPQQHLVGWLNAELWTFEDGGETLDGGDKMVTTRGRILERVETWNDRTARLFAADCAADVLHLIPESHREPFSAAIDTARRFANGEASDGERAAAWDAAGDAVWAAAWAAARDAAWAAAWAAAGDAAWAAAWAAARDAAWAAARDAARDAAWAAAWAAAGDAARAAAWAAGEDAAGDAARDAQTRRLLAVIGG
jgi:hypothetical protein